MKTRATFLILICVVATTIAAQKPNILFLIADDMPWKAVAALSDEDIETPNLDRLAARGTVFSHAYNSGGYHGAVCVASRTMLNTGKQLWWAQAAEKNLKNDFMKQGRTWSQQMSAAGYRTAMAGKWHVSMPAEAIFDQVRNVRPGMPPDRENAYNRPVEGKPDPWSPTDPAEGGFWKGGTHWSEVLVDDYLHLVTAEDPRPWFLYLAFNAPHDPRQSPQSYLDRYPPDRIKLPVNFIPAYPHRDPMGAPHSLRDERLAPMPRTEFAVKTHRREYYAIISHLDTQIGRILDDLEKQPGAANTYIIFTADQGLACGEHGLMGKQNLYDHSVRVPFLIAGPGVPAGKRIDAPIYLQDVMPTALELAGAKIPEDIDFQSLVPLWRGEGKPRPRIYGAYRQHQRMIQKGSHKLILYPEAKVARVFDLATDPHEMNDLAGTAGGKAILASLFPELLELQREMNDPLDLKAAFPDTPAP
jgi:choline-sulfatase